MGKLNDILKKYADRNPVRFHMPGNKGKIASPELSTDITELFFTDNLYNPDINVALISEIEDNLATCFFPNVNYIHSVVSCGGATLCIQGAVLSLLRMSGNSPNSEDNRDKYLICDRNSHISLINTLSLLDIVPLWIYPDTDFAESVELFVEQYKYKDKIIGVFVTSPDYYGKMKDIRKISASCKKYSLTLIVDNAHGSHLAFHKDGKLHPINNGADMSVDSIHKTLPALTGAAVLHTKKKYDKENLLRPAMRMFASTSPSFMILQSIELMTDYLIKSGRSDHRVLYGNINSFRREAKCCGFSSNQFNQINEFDWFDCTDDYFASEPYRIVLDASPFGTTGKYLYDYLYNYGGRGIVCEFWDRNNVIIIPSILNVKDDFDFLLAALQEFREYSKNNLFRCVTKNNGISEYPKASVSCINLNSAMKSKRKRISTVAPEIIGKVAAESVTVYPPGVPVVIAGELIDADNIGAIAQICEYIDILDIADIIER